MRRFVTEPELVELDSKIAEEKERKRKQANRNRARGRAQQNRVAKMTGGANVGHLGGEDISYCERIFDRKVSIETKHLNRYHGETIMKQAEKNVKGDKIPVTWVHVNKTRTGNDLITVRLKDLKRLKESIVVEEDDGYAD